LRFGFAEPKTRAVGSAEATDSRKKRDVGFAPRAEEEPNERSTDAKKEKKEAAGEMAEWSKATDC
jgi:hypothetical protein